MYRHTLNLKDMKKPIIHYVKRHCFSHEYSDCTNTVCGLGCFYKNNYECATSNEEDVTCKRCKKWLAGLDQRYEKWLRDTPV